MSYINNNSIVSREEALALKDMIFKRVKDRAASLEADVTSSYTSDVQNDLMDVARASFESNKNPFSQIIGDTNPKKVEKKSEDLEIGFAQRKSTKTETEIINKNRETSEVISKAFVEETMATVGNELVRKQSFLGALEFLNSQATISLVNKKAKSFDAIA